MSQASEDLTVTDYSAATPAMASSWGSLRVILIHDWLVNMRGGEKVLELLCTRFPDAPLSTLLYVPGSVSDTIANHPIKTSLLQHLPLASTRYRQYLPFFPLIAELSKVKNCDVVISSSHAVAKAMVKKNRNRLPLHICYIHTPMRYIWDRFDDYFGPDQVGSFASRCFFQPMAKMLRTYDQRTVNRVDIFVANSTFVADRVKRLYGREAVVLPPPVDVKRFAETKRCPEDWYLVVSALAPYKRIDHAISACAAMGRRLKIVGAGPEEKKLRNLARDLQADVEFVGFASDSALAEYYSRARGLLFPGVEDFGIVPVEAIAAGCPVIAFCQGGILESMTDRTAQLYSDQTAEGLRKAMNDFETRTFSEFDLRSRAAEFTTQKFLDRFERILERALYDWRDRLAS
jgi:glycosyltransferase involved in cell wall biosynthesis